MKGCVVVLLLCLASIPLILAGRGGSRLGGSRSGGSSRSGGGYSSRGSRSGGGYSSRSSSYGRGYSGSRSRSSGIAGYMVSRQSSNYSHRTFCTRSCAASSSRNICRSCKSDSSSSYESYRSRSSSSSSGVVSSASSSGVCNNTSNYTMKGYGTRWGTDFTNATRNMDYSNKKVGLGVRPGFIGGAKSGPIPTFAVYHRYTKFRELIYKKRYGYGLGEGQFQDHWSWGRQGFNHSFHNDYYLADRCDSSCPYPSLCKHGFCECQFGYTRRWGKCAYDWSIAPFGQNYVDKLGKTCTNNEQCHGYDINFICDFTWGEGRCQCRNDMSWNTEENECQLFVLVDCSRFTYDTRVDRIIEEAVNATEIRIENEDAVYFLAADNQTDGVVQLSREYNLKTSLLQSIDLERTTEDQIMEAFCRDVDAFSYEFQRGGACPNWPMPNDGMVIGPGPISSITSERPGIMDRDPSIGEYFLEAIDLMNRTQWRFFLPDDTDIDQDGNLSDLEVQHKFNTYMGELFKLIDDDKDNSITEEEFRSLKLDIPQLTKAVDIALENFPLRPFFLAADGNGDGVYDENDFYKSGNCTSSQFACADGLQCIPAEYQCDGGRPDCNDESDESFETCKDSRTGIDRGLNELIGWDIRHPYGNAQIWKQGGRFLFIADANGDGQISLQELVVKAKELMTKILDFFDGNKDGKISLEDFTTPKLSVGSIHNLMTELFDDVTAGQGELDLFNMNIAGQNMSRIWGNELNVLDNNGDKKLNAADVFWRLDSREKEIFLIPMLSQKLDKNQDGKIRREELRQFTDEMFNHVDMDKNGNLTLEDAYSFMRENGLDCFQVGALRSFIKVLLGTIDTQTRNFFGYVFKQLDMDGNGQITLEELEKMHIPCDMSRRHLDNDDNSNNSFDPNVRLPCEQMYQNFFGVDSPFVLGFPHLEMDSRGHGGYGGGYGGGGDDQPRRESILDKMTNTACEMLS